MLNNNSVSVFMLVRWWLWRAARFGHNLTGWRWLAVVARELVVFEWLDGVVAPRPVQLLQRRAPFVPRPGEIVLSAPPPRRPAAVLLLLWVLLLGLVVVVSPGCCEEQQRAVYQCADEHARCRAVIDALCETDDAYCPEDERTSPFSRRTSAMGECDRAYELCWLTATTTRTPDRFTRMDGGAR